MKPKFFLMGAACAFLLAGCAASTGGGHVVGNPMVSASASKKMAGEGACACGHHDEKSHKDHKGKKGHEGCGCGEQCADSCKGCNHSGGTCGGSEESCGCQSKKK